MCYEVKNRFACGHIGFNRVERCPFLGTGCFGPDGTDTRHHHFCPLDSRRG